MLFLYTVYTWCQVLSITICHLMCSQEGWWQDYWVKSDTQYKRLCDCMTKRDLWDSLCFLVLLFVKNPGLKYITHIHQSVCRIVPFGGQKHIVCSHYCTSKRNNPANFTGQSTTASNNMFLWPGLSDRLCSFGNLCHRNKPTWLLVWHPALIIPTICAFWFNVNDQMDRSLKNCSEPEFVTFLRRQLCQGM